MERQELAGQSFELALSIGGAMLDSMPSFLLAPSLAVAALIVLSMTKVGRMLQQSIEWGQRHQQSLIGQLESAGTDSDVVESYGRRSHRASVAVRLMMAVASFFILTTLNSMPATELPHLVQDNYNLFTVLLLLGLFYANIQIWTFEIATEAGMISITDWSLRVREFTLSDLVRVEKKGAAQVLLSFSDGRRARIITHVAGSRELLRTLQQAEDRNARG